MTIPSNDPEELTLSTGVVLRVTTPSAWAMTAINRQLNASIPQPPMVDLPDRGRAEPNFSDPAYTQALLDHETLRHERLLEVGIATGTEVLSVPDGFSPWEDDGWRRRLEALGVELSDPEDRDRRYIEWVKFWACRLNTDWIAIVYPVLRKVGTPEEDVAAAVDTFRGEPERGTDHVAGAA